MASMVSVVPKLVLSCLPTFAPHVCGATHVETWCFLIRPRHRWAAATLRAPRCDLGVRCRPMAASEAEQLWEPWN